MIEPPKAGTTPRYSVFLNISIRAEDIHEAQDIIETSEWVSDLSGRQSNVVPIFHALRTGRVTRVELLGLVPTMLENGEDVELGGTSLFAGTVALHGTAANLQAFRDYIASMYWYIEDRVKVHHKSRVYVTDKVDFEKFRMYT